MERNDSWRKSTFSTSGGDNGCVEAAHAPGQILVRDTTNRTGCTLPVPPASWKHFLARVKGGTLPL